MQTASDVRLTQYSHGAGCGCKIAPSVLASILAHRTAAPDDARLLVGNSARDDAAAYDLGDGRALISTTDFFMPIVDDPHTFGRIAAANAISDVYAMGGRPALAIAILGWPVETLAADVAGAVIEGGRAACAEAGIALAGGHSIDSPEPIFGLAVSGLVEIAHLKRNDTARPGDLLYLTKPLGVGILTTAEKRGILRPEHHGLAARQMVRLNRVGMGLGRLPQVTAMTDVTGFGLLGHLQEVCAGSNVRAELDLAAVPLLADLSPYLEQGSTPGGTRRNWESYGGDVAPIDDRTRQLLCDPQTSGGLLVAARPESREEVEDVLRRHGLEAHLRPVGSLHEATPDHPMIRVHA